jgi:hypothetical protein
MHHCHERPVASRNLSFAVSWVIKAILFVADLSV